MSRGYPRRDCWPRDQSVVVRRGRHRRLLAALAGAAALTGCARSEFRNDRALECQPSCGVVPQECRAKGRIGYETFSAGPSLLEPSVDLAAVRMPDGSAWFSGGFADTTNLDSVARLPPSSSVYEPQPSLHTAVSEHAMVYLPGSDQLVVVAGDVNVGPHTAKLQIYDRITRAWNTDLLPALPSIRASHGAAVIANCEIFVVGGWCGGVCAESLTLAPGSNEWQPIPDLPTPRLNPSVIVSHSGTVYVIGGAPVLNGDGSDLVESYTPGDGQWRTHTPMPTPRTRTAETVLPDGSILIIGGIGPSGPLATVERYIPDTDSWQSEPPLATARYGAAAVVVGAELLVAGGKADGEYLASTERATLHER